VFATIEEGRRFVETMPTIATYVDVLANF